MSRYTRKTAILLKPETTYGVDSTPAGATDALLISNPKITPLNANNVDRALIRPFFGGSEQLVGTAYKSVSFDVEIAGSGAAGTAPAWGPALRCCGFAEVITAASRVEYSPITDAMESATIYYYEDGALHKLLGARGNVDMAMGVGERPVFRFSFSGIDGGLAAAANPSVTLTAFKTPKVITDANTADLTFGGTYATGSITGGTSYPSKGLQISMGNAVNYIALLGGESVDITDRALSGSFEVDLTAAQEVTFMGNVKNATLSSMSLLHGLTAGNKVLVFIPGMQTINPDVSDEQGRLLNSYAFRGVPVVGNDEIKIVSL